MAHERYPDAPILPEHGLLRQGPIDREELDLLAEEPVKRAFSLNQIHARILARIVFPYWGNYLASIPLSPREADILRLKFGWIKMAANASHGMRIAQVAMNVSLSLGIPREEIIFRVTLCRDNFPHSCLIIHEGRGRFEVSFRNQGCDGIPH
jgi:hypothetical protein